MSFRLVSLACCIWFTQDRGQGDGTQDRGQGDGNILHRGQGDGAIRRAAPSTPLFAAGLGVRISGLQYSLLGRGSRVYGFVLGLRVQGLGVLVSDSLASDLVYMLRINPRRMNLSIE